MNYNKLSKFVDSDIIDKFEFYDYGHALEILRGSFEEEWKEIQEENTVYLLSFYG